MQMPDINEKDWKLFRAKLPQWQEAHMEKLNREYIELLRTDAPASEKFWALEKKIREDKRSAGVVVEMRRSIMVRNILALLNDEVITPEDLSEFSDELRERLHFILKNL